MSSLIIKVGDENPDDLAKVLFGQPSSVSSSIRLREIPNGFVVEYGRIPIRTISLISTAAYLMGGVALWFWKREDFNEIMCLAPCAMLPLIGLFYAINQAHGKVGSLMRFDGTSKMITIDSRETFQLSELEGIFDVRGEVRGGSGPYRQATALVRKPVGRFLYRLLHQCDEGYIRDDFVLKIAKRLGVACRVFDDVKFAKTE